MIVKDGTIFDGPNRWNDQTVGKRETKNARSTLVVVWPSNSTKPVRRTARTTTGVPCAGVRKTGKGRRDNFGGRSRSNFRPAAGDPPEFPLAVTGKTGVFAA